MASEYAGDCPGLCEVPDLSALKNFLRRKGHVYTELVSTQRVVAQLAQRSTDDALTFFSLDKNAVGMWTGTGKHKPMEFDRNFASIPLTFLSMGLVAYHADDRTIALTENGCRFLDLLHPDCEDPDVMLRWMGEDGFFKPDVGKSCDDWIMRFFSKMKTRVNEIRD